MVDPQIHKINKQTEGAQREPHWKEQKSNSTDLPKQSRRAEQKFKYVHFSLNQKNHHHVSKKR